LHVPLTTQLYFKDDPYIAKDPWARGKTSLASDLKQDGKFLRGAFDLALARGGHRRIERCAGGLVRWTLFQDKRILAISM
jgi:hypothetical protein